MVSFFLKIVYSKVKCALFYKENYELCNKNMELLSSGKEKRKEKTNKWNYKKYAVIFKTFLTCSIPYE